MHDLRSPSARSAEAGARRIQRRALALTSLAAVLANSSWFSATAVVPALERDWRLTSGQAAWLVAAVQIGFVVGSIAAALLNLPDRVQPRTLIGGAALAAGAANAGMLAAPGFAAALPTRLLVGVALAGVYAPAVRLIATHYKHGRGLAMGVVVGSLTLGSATPHLVRGIGGIPWQATILATSGLAVLALPVIRSVHAGPAALSSPPLDLAAAAQVLLRQAPVRLATLGYLGHMWELYALWSWLPAFYTAARTSSTDRVPSVTETSGVAFVTIGVAGLAGAVLAGRLADRFGRTATTCAAMLLSATCCLLSPVAYRGSGILLVSLLMIWGATVIADSAQFSAAVTELAEPRYAGSVLALQLALGFVLTIISIRLVPILTGHLGWRFALLPLAIGPLLGTVAMMRLRALPAARQLAGGRR